MRKSGKKSKVVCILGMHRSGTSMTARMINLLGVHLGNPHEVISKGGQFNEKGFWEHKGITQTQQRILRSLSRSWDTNQPLPENWWKNKKIEPLKRQLSAIINKDFSNKKIWGWKDPRTCLLLPMWNELLSNKNVNIHYLIVVRNPLDVVYSLERRNGFTLADSFQIWLLYVLNSLYWTNGMQRMIIDYDDFLQNWEWRIQEVVKELRVEPPNETIIEKMSSFVSPSLQHSSSTIEELKSCVEAPPQVIQVYQIVQKALASSTYFSSKQCIEEIRSLYKSKYGAERKS
ncbi:sulfotransferase family protein [Halalkalibacter sp. AB-rgal2]|uniref:sulfotransferase family protein n=1 Tax=Halalkalibacter sp. AB-rgal2 TaxID=3242695 RepID=UPI00359D3212